MNEQHDFETAMSVLARSLDEGEVAHAALLTAAGAVAQTTAEVSEVLAAAAKVTPAAVAAYQIELAQIIATIETRISALDAQLAERLEALMIEADRVETLLESVVALKALAEGASELLQSARSRVEESQSDSETDMRGIGEAFEAQIAEASETLDLVWSDFEALVERLRNAGESAAQQADHQVQAVVADGSGQFEQAGFAALREVSARLAQAVGQCRDIELGTIRTQALAAIDRAVAALIETIDDFASGAEGGGQDALRQASDAIENINAVTRELEELGEKALSVPARVAERLLRGGGLF
ncbi:hypothetical protein [Xanthobacter versatilis]|uniref:hypothetical protein n=1 Tax=Xanthobacter autotrophicus (strain ATCC BAA-1158 / Py2) TaxID=78245 RepID=UPI00372C2FC3